MPELIPRTALAVRKCGNFFCICAEQGKINLLLSRTDFGVYIEWAEDSESNNMAQNWSNKGRNLEKQLCKAGETGQPK